ncbi:MAG: AbrB family transcriptional regulator [Alphaproteobacteria bacterium]|nr:AbrB family transcriptional regulator [Alphaproteobacteria bacterium]
MRSFLGITADNRRRVALAIAIGVAGGAVFQLLSLPLAWMLGSMIAVTIAAMAGANVVLPNTLRTVCASVIGVLLGSAFSPALIDQLATFGGMIVVLVTYAVLCTALGYQLHRRFGKLDPKTAYFSSTPGGLSEMTMVGEAMGADPRIVPLNHGVRIVLVVILIPFYFRYIEGLNVPTAHPTGAITELSAIDAAILLTCGLVGHVVGKRLKMPAYALIGPMMLSAVVHSLGWTTAKVPSPIVAAALCVIGTGVGCRFVQRLALDVMVRIILRATLVALATIALAVVVATIAARFTDIAPYSVFLSIAPGGLAEMSLIALALGADTAFITIMHFVRVTTVMSLGAFFFRLVRERPGQAPAPGD